MEAKQLLVKYTDAAEYVSKIGRAERHFSPITYGRLSSIVVQTEIYHQESTSATNYWKEPAFDAALTEAIKRKFHELATEALFIMKLQYEKALISEKESLVKKLAEIEALEVTHSGAA